MQIFQIFKNELIISSTVFLVAFAGSLTCYPNNAIAYNNQGGAYSNLKNYQGAIEDSTEAIYLASDYADAYFFFYRAETRIVSKDYQGAIEDYNQVIRLMPDFAGAYGNRGFARENLKDYQGAIKDYNQSILLDPNNADAYYNRDLVQKKMGYR